MRDIVLIICIKDNVVVIPSKEGVPDFKKKAQILYSYQPVSYCAETGVTEDCVLSDGLPEPATSSGFNVCSLPVSAEMSM